MPIDYYIGKIIYYAAIISMITSSITLIGLVSYRLRGYNIYLGISKSITLTPSQDSIDKPLIIKQELKLNTEKKT